ncbi:hypothetical protein SAMN04488245_103129 [Alloyangia pacifica]|uniref:Uncharacterized protein n=2 Tax=Alloyangia pacifica TaxID=311180 RepID=A0A1I6RJ77_9RHOB|nr:hypothetical protein SAMN04488245_103129 [Alloyangia pacifica]SFS64767.1 hypothetical protein SAMN04488050_103129 [Alloyangia pacifica]
MDSLWEAVKSQEYFGPIEDLGDEGAGDEDDWLATGYAYNAKVLRRPELSPVKRGRPPKPIQLGTLTFIVRLCNIEEVEDKSVDWPWLDQACLILGWRASDAPNDYWEIENFEPKDENVASIAHAGSGLWAWPLNGKYYSYFFSIPIFALRNEHDLKKYALRPLKALFDSEDPVAAASEVLKHVPTMQPLTR